MTRMKILLAPEPVLKQEAQPVTEFDADLKKLADDMLETMYGARGIGLAANQVGVLKRILVMDVGQRSGTRNPQVLVNPEIIWESEELCTKEEGCLSIPGHYAMVERPTVVRVKYYDVTGGEHEMECEDWAAACVQHEIDHLNGVLFPEHLSRLKRDIIMKKMRKDKKQYEEDGRGDLYDPQNGSDE